MTTTIPPDTDLQRMPVEQLRDLWRQMLKVDWEGTDWERVASEVMYRIKHYPRLRFFFRID